MRQVFIVMKYLIRVGKSIQQSEKTHMTPKKQTISLVFRGVYSFQSEQVIAVGSIIQLCRSVTPSAF